MKPHKHAELIKAWADGAVIQHRGIHSVDWYDSEPPLWQEDREYRIKPEPKPDVVKYLNQLRPKQAKEKRWEESDYAITKTCIQLTFDAETGELKSAEVLK